MSYNTCIIGFLLWGQLGWAKLQFNQFTQDQFPINSIKGNATVLQKGKVLSLSNWMFIIVYSLVTLNILKNWAH